jgi:hypothetical protein
MSLGLFRFDRQSRLSFPGDATWAGVELSEQPLIVVSVPFVAITSVLISHRGSLRTSQQNIGQLVETVIKSLLSCGFSGDLCCR